MADICQDVKVVSYGIHCHGTRGAYENRTGGVRRAYSSYVHYQSLTKIYLAICLFGPYDIFSCKKRIREIILGLLLIICLNTNLCLVCALPCLRYFFIPSFCKFHSGHSAVYFIDIYLGASCSLRKNIKLYNIQSC